MKSAIVLTGNLRTFFMPTRENKNIRVCDIFIRNIIEPNNPDIFIYTDTNDFYYDGSQYFLNNQVDIVNADSHRLHDKLKFVTSNEAKQIINSELSVFFGNKIKELVIEDRDDTIFEDPKYKTLLNSNLGGVIPEMLIGQYKKLYKCANILENFENKNNFKYDIIFKGRFDAGYNVGKPLILSHHDYINTDVYAPGIKCSMIFDWYAFGNSNGMKAYLKLYEKIGEILPPPKYAFECQRCSTDWSERSSNIINPCPKCRQTDKITIGDITLSSENYLYTTFQEKNIKFRGAGYHVYVYRYRDVAQSRLISPDEIINKNLQTENITLINHDLSKKLNVKVHEKI